MGLPERRVPNVLLMIWKTRQYSSPKWWTKTSQRSKSYICLFSLWEKMAGDNRSLYRRIPSVEIPARKTGVILLTFIKSLPIIPLS